MFQGMTLFKCTECGKHFTAADIEIGALPYPLRKSAPSVAVCALARHGCLSVAILCIKRFGIEWKINDSRL